jgi:hypothetical protein
MSKNLSIHFRKNIIAFAWTWIGLLIFIGIISLFSIWSMNQTFKHGAQLAFKTNALKNEISSASIAFKVQIQEWKNILLRGKDTSDKETYYLKFEQQEGNVQAYLNNATAICLQLKLKSTCDKISIIKTAHQKLGEAYKKNLLSASLKNYDAIHALDQSVKGMDRELEKSMGHLNTVFSDLALKQHHTTNQQLTDKYHSLRKFILSILAIALTITGVSLYSVLRATRS